MTEQVHNKPSRRTFLMATGMTAAGTLVMPRATMASDEGQVAQVVLGRTGVKVSRLGIGCAPLQRPHVSQEDIETLFYTALEYGVNYLDVAPNYGNERTGFSEEKMGPVVKKIRDRVFLVSKTEEPTYEGTWKLIRQSLRRLQTDYLDLVHLHNLGHEPRFPDLDFVFSDRGALGALLEAKRKGVIRFIGASGHLHPSRFHAALDTGEIDVLMNAVNFVVQHVYDFEHKVWSRARQMNVGLVAMKVLGGAGQGQKGFRLPAEMYESAIRYALSIPGVHVAVIGMENVNELKAAVDVVRRFRPLTEDEQRELALVGLQLAGTPRWRTAYGTPTL